MYQNERLEKIMEIMNTYSFVTVKYLTHHLDYSTATINRDLNLLESKKLIKRSYGGACLAESKNVPLVLRYARMEKKKNNIARAAAALINDGDCVFIDGATTTEAMGKYLTDKKNITVITNNTALTLFLNEHNIDTINLGGRIIEPPYILGGTLTEENALKYKADKMFFTSKSITPSGEISAENEYETLRRIMRANSRECYYLAYSEKLQDNIEKMLFTLSDLSGIITDYALPKEIKSRYGDTRFIEINEE